METMTLATRIDIEKRIREHLVDELLDQGFLLSVYDGEVWTVKYSQDRGDILSSLCTTDRDKIRARMDTGEIVGDVLLVYGNDGYDVIADYSVSIGDHMSKTIAFAEKIGEIYS